MDNTWRTQSLQNYATRNDFSKLTFKKGDTFQGRVLGLDGEANDVSVKLLDGRVFPAKVEGNIDQDKLDNYLFKFELKEFEGGKFVVNIVEATPINVGSGDVSGKVIDPLMNELLKNLDFPISKEDVPILKAMLKNNIPLTENNLLEIKGLNQLVNTYKNNPELIDKFINTILEGKGIDPKNQQGVELQSAMKDFLASAKDLKMDDILIMKSLDIGLSKEEVTAFSKVTSNDYNVLNELKETEKAVSNEIQSESRPVKEQDSSIVKDNITSFKGDAKPEVENIKYKDVQIKPEEAKTAENTDRTGALKKEETSFDKAAENTKNNETSSKIEDKVSSEKASVEKAPLEKTDVSEKTMTDAKAENAQEKPVNNSEGKVSGEVNNKPETESGAKEIGNNKIDAGNEIKGQQTETKEEVQAKTVIDKAVQNTKLSEDSIRRADIKNVVKDEIRDKLTDLKDNIANLIKAEKESPGKFAMAANALESKFQEFKMFNTLNNNYYMVDVPINVAEHDFGCKLIIKDDRENGKKLDSENLKIVASVDTAHMDRVDAFITVQGKFATVEIQSAKQFVSVLNRFKGLLMDDLSGGKYGFNVVVKEKPEEFSFAKCRSFFEDDDFRTINTRV